jgi:hypothetical protein
MRDFKNFNIGAKIAIVLFRLLEVAFVGLFICLASQLFGVVPTIITIAFIAWVIATM